MPQINKILFLFFFTASILAQVNVVNKNLNPNPDALPWYIDNYTDPINKTFIPKEKIENHLKELKTTQIELPEKVDHSFSQYMRPVFVQDGGSCGSASRICYMFGYEINSYRNVDGSLLENVYPSHFTWMLSGQNSNKEQMAKFNGVPNSIDYGGDTYSKIYGTSGVGFAEGGVPDVPDYGWMTGFKRWRNAMDNRLEKNEFLQIDTPVNLEFFKSWINNHNGDSSFSEGGVAGAGIAISNSEIVNIPIGLYEGGEKIVKKWGPQVDHGTTWSGYDDNLGYDFNGDGVITNDRDNNNDGLINMADWERGALIMLNSWGSTWGNSGTVYVPYRLLKINKMFAEFFHIRKDHTPKQVMKIRMKYSNRSAMKLKIGIASSTDAETADRMMYCHHFINAGISNVPMLGKWADGNIHPEAMEFGFDLTDLLEGYDLSEPYKLFLIMQTNINFGSTGEVEYLSIIDYMESPEGKEIIAQIDNGQVLGTGKTYYFGVDMPGYSNSTPDYLYLSQSEMAVEYFDCQETAGEDGHASNVIDGDPTTIWHTTWSSSNPTHPHEIQINLGASYNVGQVKLLPRQDGENGRIADYEIYVSEDVNNWGEAVAVGILVNTSLEETVTFSGKIGQYVRLVALSEINGNPWTSLAELNVLRKIETNIVQENNNAVNDYQLFQNYPNPFNPTTDISYQIKSNGYISLVIYDVLGRKIKTLVSKNQAPGLYTVKWNGKSDVGDKVNSGIYIYTLKAGKLLENKKMILLK
ncbi:MAG: discoidin domain-containing protein [Bacteroidota bacterium]